MTSRFPPLLPRLLLLVGSLTLALAVAALLGLAVGSSGPSWRLLQGVLTGGSDADPVAAAIVWQIRLPRVVLAAVVGGTLALGGLVFQALLRNPL
ncbi:MAG: iron chelate uptake ABC transporter family permease subunit, partial [Desulfuromonadales bacterium]|nr:iron chelate uptake ABC transporter family permease subunit [Desulfuromonadales bacterium]